MIGLLACDRKVLPIANTRGGTDDQITVEGTGKAPEKGQAIMIHACKIGGICAPNGPSLATEFFEQVELSVAPNGCVLLPGHMQFWTPCYHKEGLVESKGTKEFDIREPIHFCGPVPGAAPST